MRGEWWVFSVWSGRFMIDCSGNINDLNEDWSRHSPIIQPGWLTPLLPSGQSGVHHHTEILSLQTQSTSPLGGLSSSFLLIVRLLVLVGTPGSKWRGGWPVKQAPERVLLLWLLSEQIRIVITWHSSPSHNPRTSLAGSARVFSSISNQYISSYLIVMIWLAYIRVQ